MKPLKRLLILAGMAFALVLWGAPARAADNTLDMIVAVVNEEVITERKLRARLAVFAAQVKNERDAANMPMKDMRDIVLQSLINETVMRQFAANNGLQPDRREIDAVIQAQILESGKTRAEFERELQSQGLSLAILREQLTLQLIVSQIRQNVIAPTINVRQNEIDAFLSERLGDKTLRPEVNVAHIVVRVPETAKPDERTEARQKIDRALSDINRGVEFSDVAARVSDFSDARGGGLIGWRPIERLPDIYQSTITGMQVGQVSAVINSANGFHLIKLLGERKNTNQVVERIRARHILMRVDARHSEVQAVREIDMIVDRLAKGDNFAELAKKYSQDGSAANGGDLGWLYPGDTVPEFESALGRLAVNQISQPVRSSFGWHVLQMLGRESVPLPEDKARQIAERAIVEEKMTNAFRLWLDEQTAKAYINRQESPAG